MKQIKKKFFSGYNTLIGAILTLLGFSQSCDPMAEYGVPSARFIVNGTVSEDNTEQVIEGIRVTMHYDTVFTDENGEYRIATTDWPGDHIFAIRFEDIDSVQNGLFSTLDTSAVFTNPEFENGDDSWYQGQVEQELNIKLKNRE